MTEIMGFVLSFGLDSNVACIGPLSSASIISARTSLTTISGTSVACIPRTTLTLASVILGLNSLSPGFTGKMAPDDTGSYFLLPPSPGLFSLGFAAMTSALLVPHCLGSRSTI